MELWLLYLATRFDEIRYASGALSVWLCVGLGLIIFFGFIFKLIYPLNAIEPEDIEADNYDNTGVYVNHFVQKRFKLAGWCMATVLCFSATTYLVTPTTSDAALIAAGYGATKVVQDEKVRTIFSKSAGIVEAWLFEKIESQQKESTEK